MCLAVGDQAEGVADLLLVELAERAGRSMPPFISWASAGQGEPQKWRMAQRLHGSMSSTFRPVTIAERLAVEHLGDRVVKQIAAAELAGR